MNATYEAEFRKHFEPEGTFQRSILAKYKEECDAMIVAVQREHERRMEMLKHDYEARQKFWEDKEEELNIQFQVCNGEWS